MSPAQRDGCDGFSLIELMVVVALTSVLAVGVMLALPGQSTASRAAVDFENGAAELRLRAMLSGANFAMTADGEITLAGSAPNAAHLTFHADGRVTGGPVAPRRGLLCAADADGSVSCRSG